jgi:hypothetical protein
MKGININFKKTGASVGKKMVSKAVAIGLSILALCLTYFYLQHADSLARDTVRVVKIRSDMPAFTVVTKADVEAYDIIKKEYDSDMVVFENLDTEVYNKYSADSLRRGSFLYKDQLTDEKPVRNEWLYGLSEGEEVLTLPYNSTEAGGDILLPGDLVRIRVSYEVESTSQYQYSDENPNSYQGKTTNSVRTDTLFDSIAVKDMINANGHSVYEIYKEVMRLDEKKRQDVMQSKEFISNIKPRALLLAGTSEDMVRYAAVKSRSGSCNFLITILSRVDNRIGLDSLPTLETEVRSWITG